ncbi:MAG: response regulator [Desulfosarcina sp.]|nr:response regulator [Desulfosarcina sp.]MBC2767747.1 response regulator [Desulfosarcina sp.]
MAHEWALNPLSKANRTKPWAILMRTVEINLSFLIIMLIILSWFVAYRYQKTLVEAVITSYQETQLEVVRSVSRSIYPYVKDRLAQGLTIEAIEQQIFKRFIAPIHLLQHGDAWIYTPDHVVFDLSSDFPEIYRNKSMAEIFALQKKKGAAHYEEMTEAVSQAREGVGWYIWLPDKGEEIAAWTPMRFGAHIWTIGLSTPLQEILSATGAAHRERFIWVIMTLATLFGVCLSLTSLWGFRRRRQLHQAVEQHNSELQTLVTDLENEVRRRSKSEATAKQLHDRLDTLIEALPDVIYFKDTQGRNLVVNEAYEKMIGLGKEAILGKRDEELLPPDLVENCRTSDDRVWRHKKALRFEEVQQAPDGRLIYWDSFKAPLLDEKGHLTGLVGVSRDVTATKEAEKERQRLGQQLLNAQKMEAIGALAGGVAHDLNNILSGLISYPELLLGRLPADSPLKGPLQTIQASGERAASIVRDMLTMARRGMAEKQVLNLNTIISEYVDSPVHHKSALQHPDIRVRLELEPSLLSLHGSSGDLTKIVMNLMINALESINGPGEISVTTKNCYIDAMKIGTTDVGEGEYVHLSVMDTGGGIAAEHLARIFEPFYTKKKLGKSGSGLGLAVVWGTVQDHGGAIDVHSTPGQGTVFDVYLPATRDAMPQASVRVAQELLLAKGESILVVDDVALQREIAQDMLKMLGYQVNVVDSGEAAVAYLQTHFVDLIVLDMIMGEGMDGLDTYRAIRKLHADQKAIIASGFAETDRVREALHLGAGAYVKKPFLLETFAQAIRKELER